MKKIGYTILTVIILGVTYGIIKEMNFTPLKKQDFKTLFQTIMEMLRLLIIKIILVGAREIILSCLFIA